jgi:hypothetical protein
MSRGTALPASIQEEHQGCNRCMADLPPDKLIQYIHLFGVLIRLLFFNNLFTLGQMLHSVQQDTQGNDTE